ncbi:MAG: translation initiation factor IF-3 [bacterium]
MRSPQIRLISADGEQVGIVDLQVALQRAQEAELDLVEVAPEAEPPVCRIIDFKKVLYEQQRKQREARKKSKHVELKEIKMRPRIDAHDFEFKVKHIREFLDKGNKVKVSVQYRGRELMHYELGTQVLNRVKQDLADIAEEEPGTRQSGRIQSMIMARKREG